MFAEKFGRVGFPVVCFLHKINPNPRKNTCSGDKVAQMPFLTYFWGGSGWPWVGEFVGFTIAFTCFPTPHNFGTSQTPNVGVVKIKKLAVLRIDI